MIPLGKRYINGYVIPQGICARCGKETDELESKEFENTETSHYPLVKVEHKYKYEFPVCDSCSKEDYATIFL